MRHTKEVTERRDNLYRLIMKHGKKYIEDEATISYFAKGFITDLFRSEGIEVTSKPLFPINYKV